jgi:Ni,Fe-hydrogenase III large subunit
MAAHPFLASDSPSLHEVGVGPVHAGVIEPGHFRFICRGETIEHLEIQLGYQHRGVAKLMAEGEIRQKISLAESIAGDTAIGNWDWLSCLAVEALCDVRVPQRLLQTET